MPGKKIRSLAALALLFLTACQGADPGQVLDIKQQTGAAIVVSYGNVVQPDADLAAFVGRLRILAASGPAAFPDVEAAFGPKVRTFSRGLDPFARWNEGSAITDHSLARAANVVVEQGDFPPGAPIPDYRASFLNALSAMLAASHPFGTMAEVPGSVCLPAVWKVDRARAQSFARANDATPYSLKFFSSQTKLYMAPKPGADVAGLVPARTLMMFSYGSNNPDGWAKYAASSGVTGYMKEDNRTALGLSQSHVCFAKTDGQWGISALFGYGL